MNNFGGIGGQIFGGFKETSKINYKDARMIFKQKKKITQPICNLTNIWIEKLSYGNWSKTKRRNGFVYSITFQT